MSVDATNWAWRAPVKSASRRVVLLSLADRAGEDHRCFPSVSRLAVDTCLDRKTVMKALDELKQLGFILDTGETRGKGAKVYQLLGVNGRNDGAESGLTPTKNGTASISTTYTNNGTGEDLSSTKNGTGENALQYQNSHGGVPVFPSCSTKNGTQNLSGNLSMNLSCEHEWTPNQDQLISVLKQAGQERNLKLIFELPNFEFELGAFNAHHSGRVLGEGKKLYSFATWIVDKFQRHAKQHPEYLNPIEQQNQNQDQAQNSIHPGQQIFKGVAKTFKGMSQ